MISKGTYACVIVSLMFICIYICTLQLSIHVMYIQLATCTCSIHIHRHVIINTERVSKQSSLILHLLLHAPLLW